jgi:hypothetical protein
MQRPILPPVIGVAQSLTPRSVRALSEICYLEEVPVELPNGPSGEYLIAQPAPLHVA